MEMQAKLSPNILCFLLKKKKILTTFIFKRYWLCWQSTYWTTSPHKSRFLLHLSTHISGCSASSASAATSAGKAFMMISWNWLLFQYLATDNDTCMGLHNSNYSWSLSPQLFLKRLSRTCCLVRFLQAKMLITLSAGEREVWVGRDRFQIKKEGFRKWEVQNTPDIQVCNLLHLIHGRT